MLLQGLQVSEKGDLASEPSEPPDAATPAGAARGGGPAAGVERVVVVMEHVASDGTPRIRKECTLPLTGGRVAHRIITDLATIDVVSEGLVLREVAPGVSAREVQEHTEPTLKVGPDLATMAT